MTTEIAILNKSAVALATDSAVTITRHGPDNRVTTKIYVDANKLFELIKGAPVGVMVYNSAEVAGIPWETLIKVYRTSRRLQRFDSLPEYVEDFLTFAEQRIPREIGTSGEAEIAHDLLGSIFWQAYDQMKPFLVEERNKLKRRQIYSLALEQIDTQMDALTVQAWASALDEKELWKKWGREVAERIPEDTDELHLSQALRRKTAQLLLKVLVRFPHEPPAWSGLVISGFGEEDLFPGLFQCTVAGFFEGRFVRVNNSQERITEAQPAIIRPYAQTGEALMFLQGIDPSVSRAITSFWQTWSEDLVKNFTEIAKQEIPTATTSELKELHNVSGNYIKTSWKAFADYMDTEFHKRRLEPIEASAGFLSKREIAYLAENLVEFTSLRNRVSLDRMETVGGATDVAVISKGDGFVWIERKHYFERDRNPNWGLQQAVADVASKLQAFGIAADGA